MFLYKSLDKIFRFNAGELQQSTNDDLILGIARRKVSWMQQEQKSRKGSLIVGICYLVVIEE